MAEIIAKELNTKVFATKIRSAVQWLKLQRTATAFSGMHPDQQHRSIIESLWMN